MSSRHGKKEAARIRDRLRIVLGKQKFKHWYEATSNDLIRDSGL
jgi:hypothetical protein